MCSIVFRARELGSVSRTLLDLLLQHPYGIDVDFGAHAGVQHVSGIVKYIMVSTHTYIGDAARSRLESLGLMVE